VDSCEWSLCDGFVAACVSGRIACCDSDLRLWIPALLGASRVLDVDLRGPSSLVAIGVAEPKRSWTVELHFDLHCVLRSFATPCFDASPWQRGLTGKAPAFKLRFPGYG
jgi:hypothetical protein